MHHVALFWNAGELAHNLKFIGDPAAILDLPKFAKRRQKLGMALTFREI